MSRKVVKLTKAQLKQVIKEARYTGNFAPDAEIDWVQVGPMEVLRMGRDTVMVLDWDASGADDMVTVWHNGKMKKVLKSELSPL